MLESFLDILLVKLTAIVAVLLSLVFSLAQPEPVPVSPTGITPIAAAAQAASPSATTSPAATVSASSGQPPAITTAALPLEPSLQQPHASLPADELNTRARAAVVNIFCTVGGDTFHPISGSGVVIDPRGVILTNAHVAQYFLLRDYLAPDRIRCIVRTGSPARNAYTAELLYLPPQWVADNASQITASVPLGTGENDFALLLIDGVLSPGAFLPAAFPFVPLASVGENTGNEVFLASYPAGFLGGISISNALYAATASTRVTHVFVFRDGDTDADVIAVPGTVLSQGGSSGGAVLRAEDGSLAGIITTDTEATTTAARDLRAITVAHMDKRIARDSNQTTLVGFLSGDLSETARMFRQQVAPGETGALEEVLGR